MATDRSTIFDSLVEQPGLKEARALGQEDTVDDKVLKCLPDNARIVQAIDYGISLWTRSLKMVVAEGDKEVIYFLKLSDAPEASTMMKGEYTSQKLLYEYAKNFIPKPIGFGVYSDKKTHYFLSAFVEMTDEIPEPVKFCERLAELHQKSMDDPRTHNPEGKFGFATDACQGNVILRNKMYDTWTECFREGLSYMIDREQETQSPCPDLLKYKKPLLETVVPRLLDPLENDKDHRIKPCLVHGDLWHGNASVSASDGNPYAFDSCAMWAHNEYEMGIWRASRSQFRKRYFQEYHQHIPISHPEEDCDWRNMLYAVRIDLLWSTLYDGNQRFRELALDGIRKLISEFVPDFDMEDSEETPPARLQGRTGGMAALRG